MPIISEYQECKDLKRKMVFIMTNSTKSKKITTRRTTRNKTDIEKPENTLIYPVLSYTRASMSRVHLASGNQVLLTQTANQNEPL